MKGEGYNFCKIELLSFIPVLKAVNIKKLFVGWCPVAGSVMLSKLVL